MTTPLDSIPRGAIFLESGEELYVDPGKMQATKNISMITEFVPGLFESLKRFLVGGPSFFNNRFQAKQGGGWILLEEKIPGQIAMVELSQNQEFKVRRDRWIASNTTIDLDTSYEGISGYLQGTGIAMLKASLKTEAQRGKIFFRCDQGIVKKIEISPKDGLITIDNDSVLGYTTDGLTRNLRMSGNGINSIFFGEEGIVCDFSGKGTVYIASTPQDQDVNTTNNLNALLQHTEHSTCKPMQDTLR